MTPIQLMQRLADRIRAVVKDYALQDSEGDHLLRTPSVWLQELPEKLYEDTVDAADYPFVLLMMGGGSLTEQDAACEVAIMVAGHEDAADRQGWLIPAEMTWRILTDLASNPAIGPFKLRFPVSWELPREQPDPQWFGLIRLSWELPVPVQDSDLENMDFSEAYPGHSTILQT